MTLALTPLVVVAAALSASFGCGGSIDSSAGDDAGVVGCPGATPCDASGPPGEAGPGPDAATADTSLLDVSPTDATLVDALADAVVAPVDAGPIVVGDAVPPDAPSTSSTGGAVKWFAINHFLIGTELPNGVHSSTAWQTLGYDLDGRVTSASDSKLNANTCHRVAGSPSGVLTDGLDGRDNNFGSRVMAVVSQLQSGVEDSFNQQIAAGGTTWLLRLDNVGPADNANVPGALYNTAAFAAGSTPKWDGSDTFRVLTTSLTDGASLSKPYVVFAGGYMSGGVWVSGAGTYVVPFPLSVSGAVALLPVEGAILSVRVADGTGGVFAGVIGEANLATMFGGVIRSFGICPSSSTYAQVLATIGQASDLVRGAPQWQNPSVDCEAISIGLGFTMKPVQPPTTAVAPPGALPDPCGDAGP